MNHFTFVEIPTTDLRRAQRFYSKIFGWKFRPQGNHPGALLLSTGEGLDGRLYEVKALSKQAGVVLHIEVADLDDTVRRIRRARGKVLKPKSEIPDRGWLAYVSSPDGCLFALWQPHWMMAA